jgi:uncharacterized protein with GYD domain
MKLHSLIIVSALAMGFAVPAMAQSSTMHRYIGFFKYSDAAVKAMTENPQDRSAQAAKLYESFGGKMEIAYWLPAGGEYDGFIIAQMPDDVSSEALGLMVRATGNFAKNAFLPLMTSEEFKAAMEKAKAVKSGYTPPTATKQ